MSETFLDACADVWPVSVDVRTDYRRACHLLQLSNRPETMLQAGYTVASTIGLLGIVIFVGGGGSASAFTGLLALLTAASITLGVRQGIPYAAQAKRRRLLGAAPSLVTMLTLGVGLWGTTERATAFATTADDRALADYLAAHARRSRGTPRTGLDAFAHEWGDEFPALRRALARILRASAAPETERAARLTAARRCILDGAQEAMGDFAADLRAPATALYAFGVLLPLALVSLLPAASAAGIPLSTTVLVGVYGVTLPAALVAASWWILAQRPLAFPHMAIPRSHPDVPDGRWLPLAAGFGSGCTSAALLDAIGLGWGVPVAAMGTGVGTALIVYYRPVTAVRKRVTAVETELPDMLGEIGQRIDRGQSVEAALVDVADEHSGPLTTVVSQAVARQQHLGIGVEESFCGDHGALATLPSSRTRHAATLLGAAAEIGPPAGESVIAMAEHLTELHRIERELRRDLAQVTGTLSNTAALFGPLVGGATVALAGTMGTTGPLTGPPSTALGVVVGWYVLVLATVLTALSTGLNYGLDRARVGYRIGMALLSATGMYVTAVIGTGLVV